MLEDQFFDVCVQLCVLGYLLDDVEKQQCFELVKSILIDPTFEKWTSKLNMDDIEQTAWLFVSDSPTTLLDEVRVTLPEAMQTLVTNIETLKVKNELELAKIRHRATKDTFQRTQTFFNEILDNQKKQIYELEWKSL